MDVGVEGLALARHRLHFVFAKDLMQPVLYHRETGEQALLVGRLGVRHGAVEVVGHFQKIPQNILAVVAQKLAPFPQGPLAVVLGFRLVVEALVLQFRDLFLGLLEFRAVGLGFRGLLQSFVELSLQAGDLSPQFLGA